MSIGAESPAKRPPEVASATIRTAAPSYQSCAVKQGRSSSAAATEVAAIGQPTAALRPKEAPAAATATITPAFTPAVDSSQTAAADTEATKTPSSTPSLAAGISTVCSNQAPSTQPASPYQHLAKSSASTTSAAAISSGAALQRPATAASLLSDHAAVAAALDGDPQLSYFFEPLTIPVHAESPWDIQGSYKVLADPNLIIWDRAQNEASWTDPCLHLSRIHLLQCAEFHPSAEIWIERVCDEDGNPCDSCNQHAMLGDLDISNLHLFALAGINDILAEAVHYAASRQMEIASYSASQKAAAAAGLKYSFWSSRLVYRRRIAPESLLGCVQMYWQPAEKPPCRPDGPCLSKLTGGCPAVATADARFKAEIGKPASHLQPMATQRQEQPSLSSQTVARVSNPIGMHSKMHRKMGDVEASSRPPARTGRNAKQGPGSKPSAKDTVKIARQPSTPAAEAATPDLTADLVRKLQKAQQQGQPEYRTPRFLKEEAKSNENVRAYAMACGMCDTQVERSMKPAPPQAPKPGVENDSAKVMIPELAPADLPSSSSHQPGLSHASSNGPSVRPASSPSLSSDKDPAPSVARCADPAARKTSSAANHSGLTATEAASAHHLVGASPKQARVASKTASRAAIPASGNGRAARDADTDERAWAHLIQALTPSQQADMSIALSAISSPGQSAVDVLEDVRAYAVQQGLAGMPRTKAEMLKVISAYYGTDQPNAGSAPTAEDPLWDATIGAVARSWRAELGAAATKVEHEAMEATTKPIQTSLENQEAHALANATALLR